MAFCKYSSECVINTSTQVDNIFISQFLPNAPDFCVKVYLYGLYKCTNPNSFDNTLQNFASELNMKEEDVEQAFLYWQDLGLVNVLNGVSFEIRYLPLKNALEGTRKFSKSKYGEFNKKAQDLIEGRMITSTEYIEYYTLMEVYHIEPKAFLVIMEYCTELRGKNVGYNYIVTVARNWASEGVTTYDTVMEKIKSYNLNTQEISPILKVCGIKRMANFDEQDKFLKWTKDFGFDVKTILFVADWLLQKYGKVNFSKIDTKLTTYYQNKCITIDEISNYENTKLEMLEIAKNVCKSVGVYYENLETVVEQYISKWLMLGHSNVTLVILANFCFRTGVRTLDGLDNLISKLYKKGVVSAEAIEEYVDGIVKLDAEIRLVLERLGVMRNVNSQDREFYKTWKFTWNIPQELFDLAIEKSVGKTMPVQYMNKILSNWQSKGIKTVEEANKSMPIVESSKTPKEDWEKNYTSVNLNTLFDSLEDFDL